MKKLSKRKIIAGVLGSIALCCICFVVFAIIYSVTPAGRAAATDRAIIKQTTAAAPTYTSTPTKTPKPSQTPRPTNTIEPTQTPRPTTNTPRATWTKIPTQTPTPTPLLPATSTPICNCNQDYNCSNFSTHSAAQTCFNFCGGSDKFNWSRLDGNDHDGKVCEALP
jgi:hypothetical protein